MARPGTGDETEDALPARQTRRSRRALPVRVALTVGSMGLVGAGWLAWQRWTGDDEPLRPQGWADIDPGQAERTRDYLAGEGRAALEATDLARSVHEELQDGPSSQDCSGWAEEWSGLVGEDLTTMRARIADPVLRELWGGHQLAVVDALGFCARDISEEREAIVGSLTEREELIDERLDALEVSW